MQTTPGSHAPVALVTGGSRGLGEALAGTLAARGWRVVTDGRDARRLAHAVSAMGPGPVRAIAGDVSDSWHRVALAVAVEELGRLDLLVNNASALGPSPLPRLVDLSPRELERLHAVNVVAPLALTQLVVPLLRRSNGVIVNVSSDAAVEAYEGWGGYGSTKAALDRLTAVFAAENPDLGVHAFDPGDMATEMHQRAYPGEEIGDRPSPASVVPALLCLVDERPPSGRRRAADLAVGPAA